LYFTTFIAKYGNNILHIAAINLSETSLLISAVFQQENGIKQSATDAFPPSYSLLHLIPINDR